MAGGDEIRVARSVYGAADNGADTGSGGQEEPARSREKVGARSGQIKEANTSTVTVRVEGPVGEFFSGSYGYIGSQHSVDGVVRTEYDVEFETGFLAFDSVMAVIQKRSPGPWEIDVRFFFVMGRSSKSNPRPPSSAS